MTLREYTLEVTPDRLLIVRPNNEVLYRIDPKDEEFARELLQRLNFVLRGGKAKAA